MSTTCKSLIYNHNAVSDLPNKTTACDCNNIFERTDAGEASEELG